MSRLGRSWSLSLGHLLTDGYGSFLVVLLPLIIERLDLTYAMGGLLISIRSGFASFAQLPVGTMVDRVGPRWFIILGPALTALGICLLGLASSYWVLVGLLIAVGIGSAAFHPAAASAVDVEGPRRNAAMSVFSAGGTVGEAIGPVVLGLLLAQCGTHGLPLMLAPASLLLLLLALKVRNLSTRSAQRSSVRGHPNSVHLLRLWIVELLKETVYLSYFSFLSVLWMQRGAPLWMSSLAVSLFALSGAMGGIIAGRLSEQFRSSTLISVSLTCSIPFLALFLITDNSISLIVMSVGAMLQMSSTPLMIVYSHELFPDHKGKASAVFMGLSWGVAAWLVTLVGFLGDVLGLHVALALVTALLIPAGALARGMPDCWAPTCQAKHGN